MATLAEIRKLKLALEKATAELDVVQEAADIVTLLTKAGEKFNELAQEMPAESILKIGTVKTALAVFGVSGKAWKPAKGSGVGKGGGKKCDGAIVDVLKATGGATEGEIIKAVTKAHPNKWDEAKIKATLSGGRSGVWWKKEGTKYMSMK